MSNEEKKVIVEETVTVEESKGEEKITVVITEKMDDQVIYDPSLPVITMKKLLESGSHFGHQTRKWNPKMAEYIHAARNGIHIINLEKTVEQVTRAYDLLKDIVSNQGKVLFIGTKKPAQDAVREESERSGSFYVNNRWLGGTLTNFRTIRTRIQRLLEIEQMQADGLLERFPKKEQAVILKEYDKLMRNLSGIKEIRKVPNAVVVVDPLNEINAVREAKKLGIPVISTASTNCDPTLVDIAIPVNDDSARSIRLVISVLADAIVEAKGGIPLIAHTKDSGEEVTMKDVVSNADKVNRERIEKIRAERKEKQEAFEKSRAAYLARRGERGDTHHNNSESRDSRRAPKKTEEVKNETPVTTNGE